MIKKTIIILLSLCFLFENIVVDVIFKKNQIDCLEDMDGNDSTEKKGCKKEDYKIISHYKLNFASITLKEIFYVFDEKTYYEYFLEIAVPPPNCA